MPPPLLSLRHAAVHLGEQALFADLSIGVGRGDRICLVGRNGAGKSTLLRALAGLVELDGGERFVQPQTGVAYLPQEPQFAAGTTALEIVAAGLPPDQGDHAAEAMLARVAIAPDAPIDQLSGGEARRVALAQALVSAPDILLLDEPTNHLDLPTIERLEADLRGFRGGLVLVSHDRTFLTNLSTATWWLDRGQVRVAQQGFAGFDDWSATVLAEEEAGLRRLEKTIAAETEWLHKGVTARRKRNQGRLRRLHALRQARAERVAPTGSATLIAGGDGNKSTLVIEAEGIAKRLGDRPLITDFSTRIQRGDRVGVVGPNGAGKTTLLRMLTGALAPDQGRVRLGANLKLSQVDQRRASLDLDASPWTTLCPDGGDQVSVQGRFRHVAGYLQDFLFRSNQLRTPIRALSGGERNRLVLARELARPCSLLVLDEPTNDLDMDTLDLLQEVLAEFDGTLILVSHDRDFLDRLVTSVIAFEGDGRLVEYAGGYHDMRRQRQPAAVPAESAAARPPSPSKPKTKDTAGRVLSRKQRDLDRVIGQIDALNGEIATLERDLADPDLFRRDPEGFARQSATLEDRRSTLEATETRWLELEGELEQAKSDA